MIKALSEPKPKQTLKPQTKPESKPKPETKPKQTPKSKPEIRINKGKFKKFTKDFDELKQK